MIWVVGGLLAAVALVSVFWDSVGIRIAPKWILRNAVKAAVEQLEIRFADHPLRVLAKAMDGSGRFTADVAYAMGEGTENAVTGNVLLKLDFHEKQFYGEVFLDENRANKDLIVYMDPSVMAIGGNRFSDSTAYGIRYDRFSEDIRKIPLLSVLVDDSVFDAWENRILWVKNTVEREYSIPEFYMLSEEMIDNLLLGILLLPCTVEKVSSADGTENCCYAMRYRITPESLEKVWDGLEDTWDVSFVLHKNRLVEVNVAAENNGSLQQYRITGTPDLTKGPLRLQVKTECSGKGSAFSVYTVANNTQNHISESWQIYSDYAGDVRKTGFSYCWYPQTGDMVISTPSSKAISLVLRSEETGFSVSTNDWGEILAAYPNKLSSKLNAKAIQGTVAIRKGGPVSAPECKYLDTWSLEELLQLIVDMKSLFCSDQSK